MVPGDYCHQNAFADYEEDAMATRDRHIIGVDNLLWGSDYPHVESTFPRTQQILAEILAECTEEEKTKIAGGQAARSYQFQEVPEGLGRGLRPVAGGGPAWDWPPLLGCH